MNTTNGINRFCFTLIAITSTYLSHADEITLRAATAVSAGHIEVRLRWMVDDGAIPVGGFNVYRSVNGAKSIKINAVPIKPDVPSTPNGSAFLKNFYAPVHLNVLHGVFQQTVLRDNTNLSSDTFRAMRTIAEQKLIATGATIWQETKVHPILPEVIQKYNQLFKPIKAEKLNLALISPMQQAIIFRRHLTLETLTHSAEALALGLGYTDTGVTLGEKVTYTLRTLSATGAEVPNVVASCDIMVGADPQPPAPKILPPIQTGQSTVVLHWGDPPSSQMHYFLTATYRVFRIDSTHPAGIQINKRPVMISYVQGVPSAVSFQDNTAPLGAVSYKVTMQDAFGRESQPGIANLQMQDLRTPAAPSYAAVVGDPGFKSCRVCWAKSNTPNIVYRVYRIDTEAGGIPQLLTLTPISGQITPLSTIPVNKILNLLAPAELRYFPSALRKRLSYSGSSPSGQIAKQIRAIETTQNIRKFPLLSYTDTTIQPDHYYRYIVTADYPANMRDSHPTVTGILADPLTVPPAAPTGLSITFVSDVQLSMIQKLTKGVNCEPLEIHRSNNITKLRNAKWMVAGTVNKQLINLAHFQHVIPANIGGTVNLSWQPVVSTKNMEYEVYRGSATGYFSPQSIAPNYLSTGSQLVGVKQYTPITLTGKIKLINTPSTPIHPGIDTGIKQAVGRHQIAPVRLINPHPAVRLNGVIVRKYYAHLIGIPEVKWMFLGETGDTHYSDKMPVSQANYYIYKIVAVNRWHVAGTQNAMKEFRVPATMAPGVPVIKSVLADEEGNVDVTVLPCLPDEEATQYQIYRMAEIVTAAAPSAQQNTLLRSLNGVGMLVNPGLRRTVIQQNIPKPQVPGHTVDTKIMNPSVISGNHRLTARGSLADISSLSSRRFGVVQHNSPIASLTSDLASSIISHTASPAVKALFADVNNIANYKQIGTITVDPSDTNPIPFADTSAVPGTDYVYKVIAMDKDGLHSKPSDFMDGSAIKVSADPPTNLQTDYDSNKHSITLSWNAPSSGATGYVISRGIGNPTGKFIQIAVINGNGSFAPTTFIDYNVRPGQTYTYKVRSIDSSGNISAISQLVSYTIKP